MSLMPILGYRIFRRVGSQFRALGTEYVWPDLSMPPMPHIAKCEYANHASPDKTCTCGFYAYHTLPRVKVGFGVDFLMNDKVIAAVGGSGKVLVYPELWRSEYMKVIGILSSPSSMSQSSYLASQYFGVPLLAQRALLNYVQEHAQAHFKDGKSMLASEWGIAPIASPHFPSKISLPVIEELLKFVEQDLLIENRKFPSALTVISIQKLSKVGYNIYGSKSKVRLRELYPWCIAEAMRMVFLYKVDPVPGLARFWNPRAPL